MAGKCRNRSPARKFDISLSFMFLCNIFVIINLKPFFMHFRGDIHVTIILNLCHSIFFIRYLDKQRIKQLFCLKQQMHHRNVYH